MRSAWKALLPRARLPPAGRWVAARSFSSSTPVVDVEAKGPGSSRSTKSSAHFSRPMGFELRSEPAGISLDDDTVRIAINCFSDNPEAALRFFHWVEEKENRALGYQPCYSLLEALARGGMASEFLDLLEVMKRRGYAICVNLRPLYLKVPDGFDKRRLVGHDMLEEAYLPTASKEKYIEKMLPKIRKVMTEGGEARDRVWEELEDLEIDLSADLVVAVLEDLEKLKELENEDRPAKACMFLKWAEGKPSFKLDSRTYNVMARVLARGGHFEEFWALLNVMRDGGHYLEVETYDRVKYHFYWNEKAVDLYEFAMHGVRKPQHINFPDILEEVILHGGVAALISRAVRISTEAGYVVKQSIIDEVIKWLGPFLSVQWCVKVFKAMEEGGFVASSIVYDQMVIALCNVGSLDEAHEFLVEKEEGSACIPDWKPWTSLIQRYCLAGKTKKALSCFEEVVERKGGKDAACAIEVLVNAFCRKNKALYACRFLTEMVGNKQLQPWHCTYKFLIERLLGQGNIKEASVLLGLMIGHGFPPLIDPFIDYVSKLGSAEDVMVLMKTTTSKPLPCKLVFIRTFGALVKMGRLEVAYDLASKSPD